MRDFVFSSASVTPGHPDKLCDRISDAIVDAFLVEDPLASVSAECAVATGIVFLAVRFASEATPDIAGTARRVIAATGYEPASFDAATCAVMTSLAPLPGRERAPKLEREMSADERASIAARYQATVFGYACNQTPELMPLPVSLAHRLAKRMDVVRRDGLLAFLAPEAQAQVAIEYRDRRPRRIAGVTLTATVQSDATARPGELRDTLRALVIDPVFEAEPIRSDARTLISVNPDEPLPHGGPTVHAGLTGRKTAIDTYGEFARHSGAALSGKDPGRIDRIAAYAARFAAKAVVAAELADECEVMLSYAVGRAEPVSIELDTFGSGRLADEELGRKVRRAFDFRPGSIAGDLRLRELPGERRGAFYESLATYGQVGRTDLDVPWEQTESAPSLG